MRDKGTRAEQAQHKRDVAAMFYKGLTDEEIAKATNAQPGGIRHTRIRMGLRRTRVVPRLTKLEDDFLRTEFETSVRIPYERGDRAAVSRQVHRIADEAGVVYETVRRRLREAGLIEPDEATRPKSPEQWERARELLEEHTPYKVVGKEVGIDASHLRAKIPGLGVRPEERSDYLAGKRLERLLGL